MHIGGPYSHDIAQLRLANLAALAGLRSITSNRGFTRDNSASLAPAIQSYRLVLEQ